MKDSQKLKNDFDIIEKEVERLFLENYKQLKNHVSNPRATSMYEIMVFRLKLTGLITSLIEILPQMNKSLQFDDAIQMTVDVNNSLGFIQETLDIAKKDNNKNVN
jgi:hypothetical protein